MSYTAEQFQAAHAEVLAQFDTEHPEHNRRPSRNPDTRHKQQLARSAAAEAWGFTERLESLLAERYPAPPPEK